MRGLPGLMIAFGVLFWIYDRKRRKPLTELERAVVEAAKRLREEVRSTVPDVTMRRLRQVQLFQALDELDADGE